MVKFFTWVQGRWQYFQSSKGIGSFLSTRVEALNFGNNRPQYLEFVNFEFFCFGDFSNHTLPLKRNYLLQKLFLWFLPVSKAGRQQSTCSEDNVLCGTLQCCEKCYLLFYFLMGIVFMHFHWKGKCLMSFQQCQEDPEVKVGKDTC